MHDDFYLWLMVFLCDGNGHGPSSGAWNPIMCGQLNHCVVRYMLFEDRSSLIESLALSQRSTFLKDRTLRTNIRIAPIKSVTARKCLETTAETINASDVQI